MRAPWPAIVQGGHTVVVRTGAGGRAVPGGPGGLPVGIGGEGGGVEVHRPSARAIRDKEGEEECCKGSCLGRERGGHLLAQCSKHNPTTPSLRRKAATAYRADTRFGVWMVGEEHHCCGIYRQDGRRKETMETNAVRRDRHQRLLHPTLFGRGHMGSGANHARNGDLGPCVHH